MQNQSTQLAIVGAGPGGYAAAFRAADLGFQVTLIAMESSPGGVCLYRGCIPSKALLHVAKVINDADEAGNFGVTFSKPEIDLEKINAWKDEIVKKLTGGLSHLSNRKKINYIEGRAGFIDSKTIKIIGKGREEIHLSFENAILATGSRPASFLKKSISSPHLLSSDDALNLKEIPKNLLVVGGGYIGLELGSVYAALGSRVTVVEMTQSILPGVDRDLLLPLSRKLSKIFDSVILKTRVVDFKEVKDGILAVFEGEGGKKDRIFEKVLVAVGRKPNSDGLNLESTKIKINEKGFIEVNGQLQTAEPNIYAIGDVVGEPMLAHKASHEARVAVESIAGRKTTFDPRAIPAVVYTDPEVAWCGLTENRARAENRSVKVSRFPWFASGRAMTIGRTDGVTKLILDPKDERVLGVGITGTGAGELIAEGVLAVEMGATASDLKLSIHPHPTLSETLMEAAVKTPFLFH